MTYRAIVAYLLSDLSPLPASTRKQQVKTFTSVGDSLQEAQSHRDGYSTYIQKPVDDLDTDKAIRQQYIANISQADNQVATNVKSLPLDQQQAALLNLQNQAKNTISDLNGNQTLNNKSEDVDAASSELAGIQNTLIDVNQGIVASTEIPTYTSATTASNTTSDQVTTFNGVITTPSQIPTVTQPTDAAGALAQSQKLRDLQATYLANPQTDPQTNANIKEGLANAIKSSDGVVMSIARGLPPQQANKVLGSLVGQATASSLNTNMSSNANSLDKSKSDANLIAAQTALQTNQNQINNTPPIANTTNTNTNTTTPTTNTSTTTAISNTSSNISSNITSNNLTNDGRVRLTPKNVGFMEGSPVLSPLSRSIGTNGLLFPYTPNIQWAVSPAYSTQSTVHANQDYRSFVNTPAVQITISGPFTAQNNDEAVYLVGVLHFLRVVTKMHFGTDNY